MQKHSLSSKSTIYRRLAAIRKRDATHREHELNRTIPAEEHEVEEANPLVVDNEEADRPALEFDDTVNIHDDESEDGRLRVLDEEDEYLKPFNKSATRRELMLDARFSFGQRNQILKWLRESYPEDKYPATSNTLFRLPRKAPQPIALMRRHYHHHGIKEGMSIYPKSVFAGSIDGFAISRSS